MVENDVKKLASSGFGLKNLIILYRFCTDYPDTFAATFSCFFTQQCSIVGKPLCYHASDPGSIPWGSHTTRSPPRAARLTQSSILPRSVNEYQIIPKLTPGHRR